MVVRYLANYKVGGLHQVKGKLNQTDYHSILQYHSIPSRTRLVNQGFVLMQYNDPSHASELCQRYIISKDEQQVLQLMSWPAQSANLNPIELVLDELHRNVRAKQPTSSTHLWQLLQKSWAELSSVYQQSLEKNAENLWSSYIATKGSHFDE